jgi:hypothetical protein
MLANLPAAIALFRAGLAHLRGDPTQTIAAARQALDALGEGEWMLESAIRLAAALGHASDGIALCRQLAPTRPLVAGLVTLAWVRQPGATGPAPWTPSGRPNGSR